MLLQSLPEKGRGLVSTCFTYKETTHHHQCHNYQHHHLPQGLRLKETKKIKNRKQTPVQRLSLSQANEFTHNSAKINLDDTQ